MKRRLAFSKSGKPTIIPKNPNANIGQREGLSAMDQVAIAQLYGGGGAPPPGQPPGTTPPGNGPPGSYGSYTSNRGDVSCSDAGGSVSCTFPGGSMICAVQGAQLDCGWVGGGQGRAVFTRQPNGDLNGTYGDLLSSDSRGAWTLVRTGAGPTQPPGGQPPPGQPPGLLTIPGLPPIPGPPPMPTSVPGLPFPAPN